MSAFGQHDNRGTPTMSFRTGRTAAILAAGLFAFAATAANAAEKLTYLFPAPEVLPAFSPYQLAKAKGYYTDEGIDVTFQVGKGGADVAKQVALGNAERDNGRSVSNLSPVGVVR